MLLDARTSLVSASSAAAVAHRGTRPQRVLKEPCTHGHVHDLTRLFAVEGVAVGMSVPGWGRGPSRIGSSHAADLKDLDVAGEQLSIPVE